MAVINVKPEAVRTHATNVDACAKSLSQALDASAAISAMSDQAYGILCAWIPPMMQGVHTNFDSVITEAIDVVTGVAESLRVAANDYEATDQLNKLDISIDSADLADATIGLTA